jgi:hypothetical protein
MGKRKPEGYWKEWRNMERELNIIIGENNGEFPTHARIIDLGGSGLYNAIKRYHGGPNVVRERMGYEVIARKPPNFWRDWNNVERELKIIIEKNNGEFPTQNKFFEMKKSSLYSAFGQYHGGPNAVRKRMGYERLEKPNGFWKDWDNFRNELLIAIEENGMEFPSNTRFSEMKKSSIYNAMHKYHGGPNAVRKRMGYEEIRKSLSYWKNWENARDKLLTIIEENNGEFPSDDRLCKLGNSGLSESIYRDHGGYPAVRRRMGYKLAEKRKGYWNNFDNVSKELWRYINRNKGVFPSAYRLEKVGEGSLGIAIRDHGGFPEVRERIGYNEKMREKLARELEGIVGEL